MSNSRVLIYDYLQFLEKDKKTQEVIGEIFAPFIPIRISENRKLSSPLHALADSGAARNLLPAAFGVQIGINVTKGRLVKLLGIGDIEVTAFTHKIKMYLGLHSFETEADFSFEQKIPLLGRHGFFNLFQKVIFDEHFHQLQLLLKKES